MPGSRFASSEIVSPYTCDGWRVVIENLCLSSPALKWQAGQNVGDLLHSDGLTVAALHQAFERRNKR